jgi:hypothetical protein
MKNLFSDIAEKTKSAVSDLTTSIASTASPIVSSAVDLADKTANTVKQAGTSLSKGIEQTTGDIASVAGPALTETVNLAGRTLSTIATSVFDQNGDGQLDQQDVKIATEAFVSALKDVSRGVASSSLAKETATAAVVGAAIAIPIPLIGPVVGATIGATLGAYKHFTKK